jgi:hypothetical protein
MRDSIVEATAVAVGLLLLSATVVLADDSGTARKEVVPGLYVGDVLDEKNWKLAEGLLPPEILRHYEKGEYRDPIIDYPAEYGGWEKTWLEASEENAKENRASVSGVPAFPNAPYERRQPIRKGLFDEDTLNRFGK